MTRPGLCDVYLTCAGIEDVNGVGDAKVAGMFDVWTIANRGEGAMAQHSHLLQGPRELLLDAPIEPVNPASNHHQPGRRGERQVLPIIE